MDYIKIFNKGLEFVKTNAIAHIGGNFVLIAKNGGRNKFSEKFTVYCYMMSFENPPRQT